MSGQTARETHKNEPNTVAVSGRGLGRRFGRRWALAHVDIEITRGEAVLIAGANGSGKSTLLQLVAGLFRPTQGTIEVFGRASHEQRRSVRRSLSLLAHDSYLYERLTARETVRLWASLVGRPRADSTITALLEEVGLADRSLGPVAGFSAGMRKRLSLLRVRLEEPKVVLLDEPFSALDTAGRRLVESWIEGLRAAGRTLLIASHSIERSARLCHRAMVLDEGQIVWRGPAHAVAQRSMERR